MLVFDPNGTNPTNHILNEVHMPVANPHIAPIEGVFYTTNFVVEGMLVSGGGYVPLTLNGDFIYSPQFVTRTAETGIPCYSYILLLDYTRWSRIRLSYRGTGGAADAMLQAEIVTAGNFDITNITIWESFIGELATIVPGGVDLDPRNSGVVHMLAGKLNAIALALQTPSTYLNFITNEWGVMSSSISALQIQAANWETYFGSGPGNPGDLSAYSTTTQMNAAISNAVGSRPTTTEVGNLLDLALTPYSTTLQMEATVAGAVGTLEGKTLQRQTGHKSWYVNVANVGVQDGLTEPTGFNTISQAVNETKKFIADGKKKRIYLSPGTYNGDFILNNILDDPIEIIGDSTVPGSCIINGTVAINNVDVTFTHITFKNTLTTIPVAKPGTDPVVNYISTKKCCIYAIRGATVNFGTTIEGGIVFGECDGAQIVVSNSTAIFVNPYKVTGGGVNHWVAVDSGTIALHTSNIEFTNPITFTESFIRISDFSRIAVDPIYSPTLTTAANVTGVQWLCDWSSSIDFIAPTVNWPGTLAGTYTSKHVSQLVADITIYVDAAADPNIATGSALAPFTSFYDALVYSKMFDKNGFTVTITAAAGSYSGFTIENDNNGVTVIDGTVAPGTVFITSPIRIKNSIVYLQGLNVSSNNTVAALKIEWGSKVDLLAGMNYGSTPTAPHIQCDDGAFVIIRDDYTITGSATYHYLSGNSSSVAVNCDLVTLTGVMSFTAFAKFHSFSRLRPSDAILTYDVTGATVTGKRFDGDTFALISSAGNLAGIDLYPGDVAGTAINGALYI